MTTKISTDNIQSGTLSSLSAMKISNVSISNSTYTVLDDTAVNVGGGYIVVTGTGFQDGATVLINETLATSVSFVNSTTLRAQVPAKSAATYNIYVVNPDGATAIRVNGLTYSGTPTWVTTSPLDNQAVDVAFNVAFDATGAVSYSNTTSLPAGTALLSNGYFYGTVTGIAEETTYNFTVRATDAENQEADKAFAVTVTVGPPAGILYVWGSPENGLLGLNNTTVLKSSPTQLGSSTWIDASRGYEKRSALAIKSDNTLWAIGGNNLWGQLGLNDQVAVSSPIQVGSLTNWKKIKQNGYFAIAIKTDGTLWSWGWGNYGLGRNNTAQVSSPTQVGIDTNWNEIGIHVLGFHAIKTDGTLWFVGGSNLGESGLNATIHRSSPVQVGTDTNWSLVSGFYYGVGAIKTNGTLWTWGEGATYGNLAQNNTVNKSSPTQVGTGTDWAYVSYGRNTGAAVKTDGTLWTWGDGGNLILGLSNNSSKSSPTQVGTSTDWYKISIGDSEHMVAIKTDGTLWAWGLNAQGQLGLNSTVARSSPVQVGTDVGWVHVSAGTNSTTFAIKQV